MFGLGHGHSLSLAASRPMSAPFVGALDAFTAALAVCLSVLRRLLASYTGPLMLVRADRMGQPTMDIYPLADGTLDVAALLTFAGSDSVYVVTVYDQSGGAHDATQADAAEQPKIVDAGVLLTLSGKATMLLDGTDDSFDIATLKTTDIAAYSCAMKSTGAAWNTYGGILAPNTVTGGSGQRLAIVSAGATAFHPDPLPDAVRRNGVALSSPFDCAPINSPMILGVDCHPSYAPMDLTIGNMESFFWLAASISETVAWSTVADRTAFEANQKAYFGI